MTVYNILQDAVDHWPEDEAFGVYDFRIAGRSEPDEVGLAKDIAHLESIFRKEQDGEVLVERFQTELIRLRKA